MDFLLETQIFLKTDHSSWSRDEVFWRVEILRSVIRFHSHHYYNNTPIISDGEYDILFNLLLDREKNFPDCVTQNSPTQLVWAPPVSGFTKKEHRVPMLSLQNTYNEEDIRNWHEFIERQLLKHEKTEWTYCVEAKLDGSSVEIIYEYWKLVWWITRWDWSTWEDISTHVRHIQNLPGYVEAWKDIESVHLRWEVVMSQTAFDKTNEFQINEGLSPFANPRNAAAWTLRQLDMSLTQKRGLSCYVYDLLFVTETEAFPQDDISLLSYLKQVWLPVFDRYRQVDSLDDLVVLCADDSVRKETQEGYVWCDGLVIKLNEYWLRDLLWYTEHHPRWAMAFKYPSQEIAAHVERIDFQVWRTWVITPLVILDPVQLWGVTVSKATLHNFDFINDRDIRVGDRVWIKRSGEVIPYVIGPITQRRDESVKKFIMPEECPICKSALRDSEEEVAVYCTNDACSWKIVGQLQHFVGKQSMNIQWLWDSLIEQLVTSWMVHTITDLYALVSDDERIKNKQQLSTMPGLWEKKIQALFEEIKSSKGNPLRRLLHGLWIRWVWKKVATTIADYIQSAFQDWTMISWKWLQEILKGELLQELFWIGKILARDIEKYMNSDAWSNEITILIEQWVINKQQLATDWKKWWLLDEIVIVLTWSLWISRDVVWWILEKNWALVTWSVSKKTTYLIAGDKAWSKLEKAKNLWISTVSLQEFLEIYPSLNGSFEVSSQESNKPTITPVQGGLFG